jgi:hypothetical protein
MPWSWQNEIVHPLQLLLVDPERDRGSMMTYLLDLPCYLCYLRQFPNLLQKFQSL